ncbi:MAG: DegT/DnrJ/EryC1/StrS family aminotransferase [Verrucomicrobia bacterium]|nr:DegT/DnrJ/EryC1/StrS family aminotransferase [Verrucomicrobiota bacterium]
MHPKLTRRKFLSATAAAGIGLTLANAQNATQPKPALLGGTRVRTEPFPSWPIFDQSEEQALVNSLRTGKWFRGSGKNVNEFESAYARLLGAKFCIGTNSGTNALIASMNALGVGAGDEVILPPYTFVACVNAILMLGAVPVFVDTDLETFQIDAKKIEAAITDRTVAIMPVHLGGNAADMDDILAIARKHKIAVVEDACQAHLGEWRGKKVGTLGDTGCFSFQASKNLTAGEGGAILTNDEQLAEKCFAAQSNSSPRKGGQRFIRGANLRMSEFHASLLLTQMTRLPDQAKTRDENAAYLTRMLSEIPGILPARTYEGCTRSGHHLYMFRYKKEQFANLPRAKFLSALAAEGIRGSSGYGPLNKEPFIAETLRSRGYQRVLSKEQFAAWTERNDCPENDRLCEEGAWFTQNMLLANRAAMEQIAEAVGKIHAHASDLA